MRDMRDDTHGHLLQGVLAADKKSVARALNFVESRRESDQEAIGRFLVDLTGARAVDRGHRVGLTGPPGVGKSTLASAMARCIRQRDRSIGIIAVDPTSMVSGGSLLGDRARMGALAGDEGVFIRSYATAGDPGGVTSTVYASMEVLAAAYDVVLVETVGVGQTETDVRTVVDSVALVLQPGSGDTIQFLKAGIMEIPDLFVVQKADHEALATRALADLSAAARVTKATRTTGWGPSATWVPPVLATSALHETGIDALVDAFDAHRAVIAASIAPRRAAADVAWAAQAFERLHGQFAVRVMGGRAALTARLARARDSGSNAFGLIEATSKQFLKTLFASEGFPTPEREP